MADGAASPEVQQLLELLAVVTSFTDEASAAAGAAERAAQALEAEVAAVVLDGEVAASVGFPAGAVPHEDILAVGRREKSWIEVPGLDKCQAVAAPWGGTRPGQLIIARWGDQPFSVEERNLVRGMARLMELTLTMLRTLQAEHRMRKRSEQQAAENARLLESLREQQQLQSHLSVVQRAISRREPLQQILETITAGLQDLLGDEMVGLWVRDPDAPDRAKLRSSAGLSATRSPGVALTEAGAAGEAMRRDDVVTFYGYENASPVIRELTGGQLCASMAAPVHENGVVSGGLLVASRRPDRRYNAQEAQTLRTFAQNVSLALTDAHTFDKMNRASLDTLTGLAGRGLFLERTTEQLDRGAPAALLFIDLDRFKAVNDTLGHAVGDEVLVIAADRIRAQTRPADLAGRFGGDEFALLLSGDRDGRVARKVADKVIRALSEPMTVSGRRVDVGASIGIALSDPASADPADLMRRADIAMYRAKRNGRGRYEIYAADMLATFTEGEGVDESA
ncbi:MAG TPA: sensor domain-containing diguanylate cyclase [Actinocrinis sp.]|nr:sensor domain-containing diguanylate cyclase [Actinocrinis sp.]